MLKCPRCSEVLIRRRAGTTELDGCSACGGSFFDQGELSALAGDPALLASVDALFRPTRQALGSAGSDACPKCTTAMTPFEQASMPGVQLDACRTCKGIWLDGGEATAIALKRGYVPPAPAVAPPRAQAPEPVAAEAATVRPRPAMLKGDALPWSALGAIILGIGLIFAVVDGVHWGSWAKTEATFEGHGLSIFSSRRHRFVTPHYRFDLNGQAIEGRGGSLTVPFWLVLGHDRGQRVPIAYDPRKPTHVMERSAMFWDVLTFGGFAGACFYRALRKARGQD